LSMFCLLFFIFPTALIAYHASHYLSRTFLIYFHLVLSLFTKSNLISLSYQCDIVNCFSNFFYLFYTLFRLHFWSAFVL